MFSSIEKFRAFDEQTTDLNKHLTELSGRKYFRMWQNVASVEQLRYAATRFQNNTDNLTLTAIQEISADKNLGDALRNSIDEFLSKDKFNLGEHRLECIRPFIAGFFGEAKMAWKEYKKAE